MTSSSSSNLIVDVIYGGVFLKNPLNYSLGVVMTIDHVDFGDMEFNDLVKFVEKVTKLNCTGLYYCVHGKTLSTGLRVIKCDLDILSFLDRGVTSGGRIGLYLDHCNENLADFIGKDNLTDLITDINKTINDIGSTSSDHSNQSHNEEDEVSNSISSGHEDGDVSVLNKSIHDPFLSLLCYENTDSDDMDEDINSDEGWSVNKDHDDSDGVEQKVERDVIYPSYDPSINWKMMKPVLGMIFESPAQLKESMSDYGVSNGYQLEFPVNDYKRLLVRCGKQETNVEDEDGEGVVDKKTRKCPFRLWASRNTGEGSFQIKSLNEKHLCSRKFSLGSLVTHTWIAKRYFKQIIQNPYMSLRAMQADIMRKFKCKVSPGQCDRAKKKALQDYEGGLKEHYSKLSDYKAEILRTNPGSTIEMVVNKMSDGNNYFSSYYICFKGVKDGWINGCRRVIGLDGCFLKTVCDGQLLSAIGRDANNHIFPLAWAVVSVENKENWKWFINLLSEDIGMKDGVGLTLISDQHKGILEAVKDIFPFAEHRQCTRHIYANFKKKFRGLQFKNLFWAAANSTVEQDFEDKMNEIKSINKEAYFHLVERNPKSWSRAFFEVNRACDAFENGMSENFNSCIRPARRRPIITMLEEIRTYVMQRSFKMSRVAEKLEHDVCPTIRKKLEVLKVKQRHWSVIPSDYNQFEVRNKHAAFVVNINSHTCSCRSWQLSGIPCVHTIAALAFLNKEPETYVNNWLKKGMFKEPYSYPIKPINGSSLWPKTDDIKPLPPKERRMPGRPTIKRKRAACEKEIKYSKVGVGRKMTCKNCQEKGHNTRSCKNQKKDPPPREVRPKGRRKRVVYNRS